MELKEKEQRMKLNERFDDFARDVSEWGLDAFKRIRSVFRRILLWILTFFGLIKTKKEQKKKRCPKRAGHVVGAMFSKITRDTRSYAVF